MNTQRVIVSMLCFVILQNVCMDGSYNGFQLTEVQLSDGTALLETWKTRELRLNALPFAHNISVREMHLVGNALNTKPGAEFKYYYDNLSPESKNLLITAVGACDSDGKAPKLHSAYLTEQLVAVYHFPKEVRKRIKKHLKDTKNNIHNYFMHKIVLGNSAESNAEYLNKWYLDIIRDDIHPTQHIVDGWKSYNGFGDAIPLFINGTCYATYETCFFGKNIECRITDTKPLEWIDRLTRKLSDRCLLWIIDHDTHSAVAKEIVHKSPVRGCLFSNKSGSTQYVVTYADNDICFATLTFLDDDGMPHIEVVAVDSPDKIIAVSFDSQANQLASCTYEREELSNVIKIWSMDGNSFLKMKASFADDGVTKQLLTIEQSHIISGSVIGGELRFRHCGMITPHNSFKFINGDATCLYVCAKKVKLSDVIIDEQKICAHFYSPCGRFLIHVVRKHRDGKLYIEAQILDAATHAFLAFIWQSYKDFSVVGFSSDGTALIFAKYNSRENGKVPLFSVEDGKKMDALEDEISLGKIALLHRLTQACVAHGSVRLHESEPAYRMLQDLSDKSNGIASLIQKYLIDKNKPAGTEKEEKKGFFWW